jgi:hypothetical protein
MTQLNTPDPATAYLAGCLRRHAPEVEVVQADFSIELFLRLFSAAGVQAMLGELGHRRLPSVAHLLAHGATIAEQVGPVVRFLQGRDPSLALRIVGRTWLPEGPRFAALAGDEADPLAWAFGELGTGDRARHLASLFIDDLADAIRDGIDPRFELSRYGEKLAASAPTFDVLAAALAGKPSLVDRTLDELTGEWLRSLEPDVVGLTVPFPGNVYGALRVARASKRELPAATVVMGGGYVNTELRQLVDPRVFAHVDYITLDDGERPLLALLEHLGDPAKPLLRTYRRVGKKVVLSSTETCADLLHRDTGTPTYGQLPLDRYVSLFEMLNPMHRLWSDGRWNKLTIAKGCYWRKCTFCDISLDYIGRYEPASADLLVDRIEAMIAETGQTGFHFVDEAAPPAGLRALAERLIARRVAISGGLEVASDRLLGLMQKGVTVEQVARVAHAFTAAGVLVHAYLMYGFPTETLQETVDALERVRQLFACGCIQSGFWHRFAATAHSPIGQRPELFGIRLARARKVSFARNELPFVDPTGTDHERLGGGLRRALYNFMHGLGLDEDVRSWFEMPVPGPEVPADLVQRALGQLAG